MRITTSGILSFEDCEKTLRPDTRQEFLKFAPSGEKNRFCTLLLSEIPISIKNWAVADFRLVPLSTQWQPFRPYGILLYVPEGFDFLSAPLFAEALSPILSFALRRRVKAYRRAFGAENPPKELQEDVFIRLPCVGVGPENSLQQKLTRTEEAKRFEDFSRIYLALMKMDEGDFFAVLRALRMYQLSLLTYREDIGLAYTLLVASIESVACNFLDAKFSFDDLPDAGSWSRMFALLKLTSQQTQMLMRKLARTTQFLSLTFRRFIETYLPESFWVTPDSRAIELDSYLNELQTEFASVTRVPKDHFKSYWWLYSPERKVMKTELDGVLKAIYELRSKFAHEGKSPPFGTTDSYETAEIVLKIDKEGHITPRRSIPSYFWFERVVYECISSLLKTFSG